MIHKQLTILALLLELIIAANGDRYIPEKVTPATKEYESIVDEITRVTSEGPFFIVVDATKIFDHTIDGNEALAKGLVKLYAQFKPDSFALESRFSKLYEHYVNGPCKIIDRLAVKFNDVMSKYPDELRDYKFKSVYVPNNFQVMPRMCAQTNLEDTFDWFKKVKSGNDSV